jgi:hypothetical protein
MAGKSTFTQKTADLICERLANGESIRTICKAKEMPAQSTIFKWLADNASFSEQYARAREAQADLIFEEMFEIADDASNDWMQRKAKEGEESPGFELNGEHIQRSRLRIDARKWMLSKMAPKKYGDKIDVAHSGNVTVNINK